MSCYYKLIFLYLKYLNDYLKVYFNADRNQLRQYHGRM